VFHCQDFIIYLHHNAAKKPEICKETKQTLRREDKEAKAKPKRKEKLNIFNALRATFQDFFWKTLNVKSLFVFSLKQYIEIVL